ncbi:MULTISPECIES: UbiX family flavin prenyltransferase [Paraburkholderia]|uniref:Flavin prenyltransferase UbiX n=1 Tax=Paraburkholderia strydomiana TaxID=1245417 RepID=A0ABW9BZN3_9BURK|nr:UbiX family flavin prenyltransferase [Paraburkholderia caledonica]OWJ59906.1 3-octaprenyl-4-hydroxybenzoate carboxy-lyase [Burkholderia sp. Bk]CAH2902352.1 MAG: Flavin prenyltransferase UbiX [uncultured Paraburkholderia sp.]CAH2917290.1 MAG: Flavin prenyltransferase UbiX [uncultured Paraburkholderia sp.]
MSEATLDTTRHDLRAARTQRIVVGISGASGALIGARLLAALRRLGTHETHLIVSASGAVTAAQELGMTRGDLDSLADVVYNVRDIGAAVASGSFITAGMVIAPCSMKTLAAVANGFADNLLTRAADVMLKERRRLVMVARETPLNLAHLRNMTHATEMGAIVMPPVPAFYAHPKTIEDVVDHTVGRILDLFGIEHGEIAQRWSGLADEFAQRQAGGEQ